MKKSWYEVSTEDPNSERGDTTVIGTYFGHVDDLALRLADKQRGFWCDGKLITN